MEDIPDKLDSKFRFVLVAATRAEQLIRGGRPKVEAAGRKPTTVAMSEVMSDKVEWDYGPPPQPEVFAVEGEESLAPPEGEEVH